MLSINLKRGQNKEPFSYSKNDYLMLIVNPEETGFILKALKNAAKVNYGTNEKIELEYSRIIGSIEQSMI